MKLLRALSALMLLAIPAAAFQGYTLGPTISTTNAIATQSLAGLYNVAASSASISTPTATMDGPHGVVTFTNGPIYPQSYGARADCASAIDDTAAIQRAINAAGTGSSATKRRTVHFPAGCYYTTGTVTVSSRAYITIEGDGRFSTYIYNVGASSGALALDGGPGFVYVSSAAISNLGGNTVKDIGLGSNTGPALYMHGTNNALIENLLLFSAGPTTAYLLVNGGAQNQFSDLIIDGGNTNTGPAVNGDPSGYWGNLVNYSSGVADITIQPSNDAQSIQVGEMTFQNIRMGAQVAGNSINVLNTVATNGSIGVWFSNIQSKARNGGACFNIDGAQVFISNSYCETTPLNVSADSVYIHASVEAPTVFINNMSGSGVLHINTSSAPIQGNLSVVGVNNSSFYQLKIDSSPYYLYGNNNTFQLYSSSGTGALRNSVVLNWQDDQNFNVANATFSCSGGNCGIGQAGPNYNGQLDIMTNPTQTGKANIFIENGVDATTMIVEKSTSSNVATGTLLQSYDSTNSGVVSVGFINLNHAAHTADLVLGTHSHAQNLVMKDAGNIGLNTSIPALQLDVNGGTQIGGGAIKSTMTSTGFFIPYAMTLSQIQLYTPSSTELHGLILCSNCTSAYSVCQSTGATIQGFRLGTTGTTACQ